MDKFNMFISQFNVPAFDNVVRIGRNYFYAEKGISEFRDTINHDVFSLGIFLGEEKNDFKPSPACIDMISKMPGADKRKVFINKKAEWLFICGRNILEPSIVKNPNHLREGIVLVQNIEDENLGYGLFRQEGKDLILRNILDKGEYLRMNQR